MACQWEAFSNLMRYWNFPATILFGFCVAGCSGAGDGTVFYSLSGTVTLDGQPVKSGDLSFEPDASKGNQGPGILADVQEGRFTTPSGYGTVGGPHRIRLSPKPLESGSSAELAAAQFPSVTIEQDLPKQKSTTTLEFQSPKKKTSTSR